MAIKSKEEIISSVREIIGERDDDNALAFIENLTDTLDDYDTRVSDSTDWKTLYETNDREWREKYRERFFEGSDVPEDDVTILGNSEDNVYKVKSFDELFEVK